MVYLRKLGVVAAAAVMASALPWGGDAQAGTVRLGLTLEDGTVVVTDNYLKVRIPAGTVRNERVVVRLGTHDATLVARLDR